MALKAKFDWVPQARCEIWLRMQDPNSHGPALINTKTDFEPPLLNSEVPPTGSANQFTIEFGYNEAFAACVLR